MDETRLAMLIGAYLDDELDAAERCRVEALLAHDPRAQKLARDLSRCIDAVKRLGPADAPVPSPAATEGDDGCFSSSSAPGSNPRAFRPAEFLQAMLARPGELISAYTDGELAPEHVAQVANHLLVSVPYRQEAEDLIRLRTALSSLPIEPAPAELVARTLAQIETMTPPGNEALIPRRASAVPARQRKRRWERLIDAYLEDRLSPRRREFVEHKLAVSERFRRRYDEQSALRAALHELPIEAVPEVVLARALAATIGPPVLRPASTKRRGLDPYRRPPPAPPHAWVFRATHGIAAAAAILLIFAVGQFLYDRDRVLTPVVVRESKSAAPRVRDDMPAAAPAQWPDRPEDAPLINGAFVERSRPRREGRELAATPRVEGDEGSSSETPSVAWPGHTTDVESSPLPFPLDQLVRLRPGDVVTTLDRRQLRFLCLNVEAMYGRLHVVLKRHELAIASELEPPGERSEQSVSDLYVVNVAAPAAKLAEVLSELGRHEREAQLIREVKVSRPDAEIVASLERVARRHLQVPRIVLPHEPLASIFDEPSMAVRIRRPSGPRSAATSAGAPKSAVKVSTPAVSPAAELPKPDRNANATATKTEVTKSQSLDRPKELSKEPSEATPPQVRVLIVLEPDSP